MEAFGRWDHYVQFRDLRTGIWCRERCYGIATAEAVAASKRRLGFYQVEIVHRRYSRIKERESRVYDRRLHGQ